MFGTNVVSNYKLFIQFPKEIIVIIDCMLMKAGQIEVSEPLKFA